MELELTVGRVENGWSWDVGDDKMVSICVLSYTRNFVNRERPKIMSIGPNFDLVSQD